MHVFPRNDLVRRRWTAFVRDTQTQFQARRRQNIGASVLGLTLSRAATRPSLGVLHPHSSDSDLQEKLTFGERIGATIDAGIFSIMSDTRVEWQSKWTRVEKYGRLVILFILFYRMNYITYYCSRKPVAPAPLVFHKRATDSPNTVYCVQFGQPIELRLTSQTFNSLCPVMHFASFPTKVNYRYDVSIGKNFSNSTNSWHN